VGPLGAAAAAAGGSGTGLVVLFVAIVALILPRIVRRLWRPPDRRSAAVFFAVLERPG
jgi:hypothetical protein